MGSIRFDVVSREGTAQHAKHARASGVSDGAGVAPRVPVRDKNNRKRSAGVENGIALNGSDPCTLPLVVAPVGRDEEFHLEQKFLIGPEVVCGQELGTCGALRRGHATRRIDTSTAPKTVVVIGQVSS